MNKKQSAYSTLKVLHHPEQLQAIRMGVQAPPVHVQLIISDLCNHDCHFCAYRLSGYTSNELFSNHVPLASFGHNNPKRMIPAAKIMEILEDCAEMGVKAIQLTGGGEPTVHPKHPEAMAKILDLGMELSMVTNGQALRDAAYESLCRATWLRVSIDAGNRKSYAAIRRINSDVFDRVWGNVERLADGKSASTELGCGFVVTPDNWTEIGDFLKRAKESGANNARISAFFQNEDELHYGDRYEEILSHLREESVKYESDGFSIHNNFADRYADMAQKFPEYGFCGYQKFTTYIGADLNVYRCCNTAYSSKGIVGNLTGQRFREMWADAYQSQRDFDPSSNCPRCQFNRMNEVINYVSIDEPTHANYP